MVNGINDIQLMAIPDLMGRNFFIPDYQRGYRWDKLQIFQLLSDIDLFRKHGSGSFYCLQPIIVKKCEPDFIKTTGIPESQFDNNTWYEVIDGQQRLTTIRLIIEFHNLLYPTLAKNNCYNIYYKTRPSFGEMFSSFSRDAEDIICNKDISQLDIDSYHVYQALRHINEWFTKPGEQFEERSDISNFPQFFSVFFGKKQDDYLDDEEEQLNSEKSVQVLWYELKDGTRPQDVFKRLNDSKIELTNSELIRALFLSESSVYKLDPVFKYKDPKEAKLFIRQRRQAHISEQWDVIEHQLRDDNFWAFITNNSASAYSCRIEYLFDLISQKSLLKVPNQYGLSKKDDRYTYLYFDREIARTKKESPKEDYLWGLWKKIETYYSTLLYWYEDRDLYHWIGYLIYAKDDSILPSLLKMASEYGRRAFKIELIEQILGHDAVDDNDKSVPGVISLNYAALKYPEDNDEIEKTLTLYNTETYRCNPQFQFFPFRQYKAIRKTIEHIHAQNSEGLPKDDNLILIKWLEENIDALKKFKLRFINGSDEELDAQRLIDAMEASKLKGRKGVTYNEVTSHFDAVLAYYNSFRQKEDKPSTTHEFFNLTILSGETNTAVGKSAFEIKRQKLIKMDAEGKFIPYCTKKVFFKYCNINDEDFEVQQTSCWNDSDKQNYESDIVKTMDNLGDVLNKLIQEEKEDE